jgi:hypothetical protein
VEDPTHRLAGRLLARLARLSPAERAELTALVEAEQEEALGAPAQAGSDPSAPDRAR